MTFEFVNNGFSSKMFCFQLTLSFDANKLIHIEYGARRIRNTPKKKLKKNVRRIEKHKLLQKKST